VGGQLLHPTTCVKTSVGLAYMSRSYGSSHYCRCFLLTLCEAGIVPQPVSQREVLTFK
jgi:hypothetical protein